MRSRSPSLPLLFSPQTWQPCCKMLLLFVSSVLHTQGHTQVSVPNNSKPNNSKRKGRSMHPGARPAAPIGAQPRAAAAAAGTCAACSAMRHPWLVPGLARPLPGPPTGGEAVELLLGAAWAACSRSDRVLLQHNHPAAPQARRKSTSAASAWVMQAPAGWPAPQRPLAPPYTLPGSPALPSRAPLSSPAHDREGERAANDGRGQPRHVRVPGQAGGAGGAL